MKEKRLQPYQSEEESFSFGNDSSLIDHIHKDHSQNLEEIIKQPDKRSIFGK